MAFLLSLFGGFRIGDRVDVEAPEFLSGTIVDVEKRETLYDVEIDGRVLEGVPARRVTVFPEDFNTAPTEEEFYGDNMKVSVRYPEFYGSGTFYGKVLHVYYGHPSYTVQYDEEENVKRERIYDEGGDGGIDSEIGKSEPVLIGRPRNELPAYKRSKRGPDYQISRGQKTTDEAGIQNSMAYNFNEDKRTVGRFVLARADETAQVEFLNVEIFEPHRRRGLCRLMIDYACGMLQSEGIARAILLVWSDSDARKCFEKAGFRTEYQPGSSGRRLLTYERILLDPSDSDLSE